MRKKNEIRIFSSLDIIPNSLRESYPLFSFYAAIRPYDIISAIDDEVSIIAILDKNREDPFTISAGEIIDGLRCGIKIYGASEVGALRAKECKEFGMIGVGSIYQMIESNFAIQEHWIYQATSSHQALTQQDASLLLSTIQKEIEEVKLLNDQLWQAQEEQFHHSQCMTKWKWVHE